MKTRFIFRTLIIVILLAVAAPSVSFASEPKPVRATENNEAYANQLKNRLEEIRALDTKKLTKEEKRALRGEVKAIKKELAVVSGGVYISVGAILLIALLIILLA